MVFRERTFIRSSCEKEIKGYVFGHPIKLRDDTKVRAGQVDGWEFCTMECLKKWVNKNST